MFFRAANFETITNPCIGLITDFGLTDPYVAQLKAVLLSHCPGASIIDISHGISTFNIRQAAFFLKASQPYFPEGSFFLAVVDPGVGSSREIIVLQNETYTFIAPNNGLLALLDTRKAGLWKLFFKQEKQESATFAGRDIMAAGLGRLLTGCPLQELAEPLDSSRFVRPEWSRIEILSDRISSDILHIDHFGNVVLNIEYEQWHQMSPGDCLLNLGGKMTRIFSVDHYARIPPDSLGILPGSQGYMELAMNMASAAARLGLESSDYCRITLELLLIC